MCGFCRHESTLRGWGGGVGTHDGAEMQEDLWLTDKRRGGVTERSSSGIGLIRAGAGNEERKCSWVLFPTV